MIRISASILFLLGMFPYSIVSQSTLYNEKPPVFDTCKGIGLDALQDCFDKNVYQFIYANFKVPDEVSNDSYTGEVSVLFEVDTTGTFQLVYVDALYETLKEETKRVFSSFPQIEPATYNGRPTYKQYAMSIKMPFLTKSETYFIKEEDVAEVNALELASKREFDSMTSSLGPYENKRFSSQLNIPFTHSYYAQFDRNLNLVGTNSHTASKPFLFDDIATYYDFEAAQERLKKEANTWVARKLWNEHLVQVQSKDYWFTIDPIFDLQVGKDTEADFNSTYNNTRGILVQGGLGNKLNFYTSVFESQGRFAEYINEYSEGLKAFGPDPAIIPGRGIAKRFKTDSYDYPVAEAYLSYTPTKFINMQFGHGKNFIGDGYRSLFLSDVASPSPFLKLNTTFWKIKYTNTWMWLKDVRPEVNEDGAFLTKYMANHFLSWNVSKRLNLGFFESVLWTNSNDRGFDINYLNPIIFYRAIEFETGQGAGNAIVGASAKYKLNDNLNLYSQFILDEFSLNDIKAGEKSWKNKYGYQLGLKYYNAFHVDNLMLQMEYNRIRPYTYSHNTIVLNYGHNNQSMAHLWGANLSELVLIGHYQYQRWFADAKLIFGKRGIDFNNGTDNFSYGGDIYRDYNERPFDTGIEVGQGNAVNTFYGNLQGGYLINPVSNLKLFADITIRNFNPDTASPSALESDTVWFNLGLRTDLFNWYFDF
ncbi:gliding motility protein RemB [Aestuariivivens sediminicola]|uniref:gliding motility protein RemB n=1 Tax=Aestuariivivens sediminicola TaxID=2913560 RepID=UPI001F5ACD8B|nr:gliding motility protein RemB [Aestuariivivens sediminicola]